VGPVPTGTIQQGLHIGVFSRLAVGLVLVTLLAGCLDTGATGGQPFAGLIGTTDSGPGYKRAVKQARLAGGAVVVPAPKGFCIDPASLRRASNDSFALLASCAALGAGPEFDASIFTVTVSPRQAGMTAPSLGQLVSNTRHLGVLAQKQKEGVAVVQLAKGGNSKIAKADPKHWRAVFMLNERLVALSAYGETDSPLARSTGGRALERLAAAIRKASPERKGGGFDLLGSLRQPETAEKPTGPAKTRQTGGGFKLFRKTDPDSAVALSKQPLPEAGQKNPVENLIGRLFQRNDLDKE
jgi:hypothetical protein